MTAPSLKTSPAQLFLEFWQAANNMSSHQRLTATIPEDPFKRCLAKALQQDSAQDAFDAIESLRHEQNKGALRYEKNGCIIAILLAIDALFYSIHPRTQIVPAVKSRQKLPAWLRDLRDRRLAFGHYASNTELRLIARGPLLRRDRDENASNAENFADRFTALSVVPDKLHHKLHTIKTQHLVIGLDDARGVAAGKNPGAETVVFIPVAEQAKDLHITEREINSRKFADFWLHHDLDAADILFNVLNQIGAVDIAFAPEFVVTEKHADKFAQGLQHRVSAPPRITVAGSGQTTALSADKQAWNESRILNGIGCELWRQRKIWPAGLIKSTAISYGLTDPGSRMTMEDSAEGDTLVIADVDGFGRCVVLICQDIHLSAAVKELLDFFQPDWVFIPILDAGISAGRWVHQESFAVSGISNARFMIVSSLALAKLAYPTETRACALAVGPKAATEDGDKGRAFQAVSVEAASVPGYAKLQWRNGDWKETVLGSQEMK